MISQNKTEWKAIEPPKDSTGWFSTLFDIVWTGTQFVAIGDSRVIITSFDGEIWNTQSSPLSGPGDQMHAISWNGTTFVIALSRHMVMTSPDAVTWTKRTVDGPDFTLDTIHEGHLLDVAWSGTRFVAVGYYAVGTPSPELRTIRVTSGSGVVNWFWEQFGSLKDEFSSVYAKGEDYVAVGEYGHIVSNFLSLNNGACNIVVAAADPATPSTETTSGGQTGAKGGGGVVDNLFFLAFVLILLARSFKGRRPR